MVPDLRRKLISILGADPDGTDAQLIAHARHVRRERDTYKKLAQLRPPVEKTWAGVGIGELIVSSKGPDEGSAVWMVAARLPGEDGIEFLFYRLTDAGSSMATWTSVRRPDDTVTVLGPVPQGDGLAALAELVGEGL